MLDLEIERLISIKDDPECIQEAWALSQVILCDIRPDVYKELQKVRTQIMSCIDFSVKPSEKWAPVAFTPKEKGIVWNDIEITPEVTGDSRLSFVPVRVSTGTIYKLKRLLDKQREVVEGAISQWRSKHIR